MGDLESVYADNWNERAKYERVLPFEERLADFIIGESHRTGETVQDLWCRAEKTSSESQVSLTE